MADWKQITARIRRARTSKEPVAQLTALFEKTHDAMVAFELARHLETGGQISDAAKWYTAAAERFRRGEWKTKAQLAASRLTGEPVRVSDHSAALPLAAAPQEAPAAPASMPNPELPFGQDTEALESAVAVSSAAESAAAPQPVRESGSASRRRRGRRGGRNRRKSNVSAPPSVSAAPVLLPGEKRALDGRASSDRDSSEIRPPRVVDERSIPRLPVEPLSDSAGLAVRGRSGDPGLSSRLSQLEMQLRRLLTSAAVGLDQADQAPAGPGVFVLTDSDLTSYYYVEACQTLRIAIPNLIRGGASRRGADSIKPQLAEHLGIPESRVAKYLADHCVVRWLQLDEGASRFAHFAIAVLRPILNE